jgi:hypothetical protein
VEFPAYREKCSEILAFRPIFGKSALKESIVSVISIIIPYPAEQGIFWPEQGIQIPCSAENRDISAFPVQARSDESFE